MSGQIGLLRHKRLRLGRRIRGLLVWAVASRICRLRPRRIFLLLHFLARGGTPADRTTIERALEEILAVSVRAGGQGCLLRSVAIALLCRIHGFWPTWKVGVQMSGNFFAHAWVEDPTGCPVRETVNTEGFVVLHDVQARARS